RAGIGQLDARAVSRGYIVDRMPFAPDIGEVLRMADDRARQWWVRTLQNRVVVLRRAGRRCHIRDRRQNDLIDRHPVLALLDTDRLRTVGEVHVRSEYAGAEAVVLPAPPRHAAAR